MKKSQINHSSTNSITFKQDFNEDLVESDDISEQSIMHNLESRFFDDHIYSSIGPIIIAMNPYKFIPELYSSEVMDVYMSTSSADNLYSTSPHIWRIAHGAYVNLAHTKHRCVLFFIFLVFI